MGISSEIDREVNEIEKSLIESGYFRPSVFQDQTEVGIFDPESVSKLERALDAAARAQNDLEIISERLREQVVNRVLDVQDTVVDPQGYTHLETLLRRILNAVDRFKAEPGFVAVYGELLSVYILTLYRLGYPGNKSPLIETLLRNLVRRKAAEINPLECPDLFKKLEDKVTVALITKRHAAYVLAARGLTILFRSEISFRNHGTSPENLALRVINLLVKHGVRLADVTEIVTAGGDLGTLPGGIYVLDERVKSESRKRLSKSSLNRGALVGCALKELLREQGVTARINLSLASPLSFTTLDGQGKDLFLRSGSRSLKESLRGYVKATPLKSIASILSEIQRVPYERLNLVVLTLDELFASVVKKVGPRVERELAAQDANEALNSFDFNKIVEAIHSEGCEIPAHFRLAQPDIGTGAKEVCELLNIIEWGKISPELSRKLGNVVNSYAEAVAKVITMACVGKRKHRPHYIVVTSMMALDPHFHQLFAKIRNRLDRMHTPVMCLDSLEHEYLIARHLFEVHTNPSGDKRLSFSVESTSLKKALKVLESPALGLETFSFFELLEQSVEAIKSGNSPKGKICLVGADNDEALEAVFNAKDYGLIDKIALIGAKTDIEAAAGQAQIPLETALEDGGFMVPIETSGADHESEVKAIGKVFGEFLERNPDYMIMKGSLSTAAILKEALVIYRSGENQKDRKKKPLATHTSLFVLPEGRFFALSDAAVNPSFTDPNRLVMAVENQVDVVRRVVGGEMKLKVAIITAVEKETSAIPSTHLAAQTVEAARSLEEKYGPMVVEGPLSFDLATVPEVSREKNYSGEIQGDANCLIATDINTANVIYKMLSKTMGSLGLMVDTGSIITAGPKTSPIVLTSRGDTSRTKFNSILLAYAYGNRK
jgi:phosphate butyryltransferase